MNDAFVIHVEPHLDGEWEGKYDIHVTDSVNGKTLVFSNQGYENRKDAIDVALKLFGGTKSTLRVYDADMTLIEGVDLR